jgi:2-desacetyl-2-hydroxyethyl bacteriochlorophyllide A dehydrogenase
MKKLSLYFKRPFSTEIREAPLPLPAADQVLVATHLSAISAGTEMLVFEGRFPEHMAVDATLPVLASSFQYPLTYGYSCMGRVVDAGSRIDPDWIGRYVFAFHPHTSHFVARPEELMPLGEDAAPEDGLFLAAMETAVNLVMDGRPVIGERVVVLGQGVIGLLTTALLAHCPLAALVGVDPLPARRAAALNMGAHAVLSGMEAEWTATLRSALAASSGDDGKADLVFELSGNPDALDCALACAGVDTRIIVGSWYGTRPVAVNLGGDFHRDRISIISSQVSTIAAQWTGRWSKSRRLQTAWKMIRDVRPSAMISHRFPIHEAQKAYECLSRDPGGMLQAVFTYPTA